MRKVFAVDFDGQMIEGLVPDDAVAIGGIDWICPACQDERIRFIDFAGDEYGHGDTKHRIPLVSCSVRDGRWVIEHRVPPTAT